MRKSTADGVQDQFEVGLHCGPGTPQLGWAQPSMKPMMMMMMANSFVSFYTFVWLVTLLCRSVHSFLFFCYPSQTPRHSKLVNSCLVVGRLSWAIVNVMGLVFICCAAAVIGLGLRLGSGFHFGFSFCQMELYQIKLRLAPKGLAFDKCAFLAISLLWQTDFNMQIH